MMASASAQFQPQQQQQPPSNWSQRNAGFVPPTKMGNSPPNREFNTQQQQQQQQAPAPAPAPAEQQPRPTSSGRSSSFFSFGRNKNGTGANGATEHGQQLLPQQPPPQQQQPPPPQPPPPVQPSEDMNQPQPPQPPAPERLSGGPPPQPPPLHPELRSFVSLAFAHVHKIYFSGPLIRKIDKAPDGQKPLQQKDDWTNVWAQLGGTTLSIWDMKEIEEANKQGREVPPSYINVTDAFVQVLGSITMPSAPGVPPKRFTNVLTLNTAGSNLILFSCPDAPALVSWASAFRLAAWEKARLEEIYTAHLLRMTLSDGGAWREPRTTLVKGRMEGWAQVRIAGQTEWKRVWLVLNSAAPASSASSTDGQINPYGPPPPPSQPSTIGSTKSRRISNLFGGGGSASSHEPPPAKSSLAIYQNHKARDKKKHIVILSNVTQVFAVYPERPEMISRSTLIKVEGTFSDDEGAGQMRGREAWVLIMPEIDATTQRMGVMEMLKWIVGLHDSFSLYGRPASYTWDPRDPISMMFAYPFGPLKDHLFLDRELAEGLDPRDDRTSAVRSRLLNVLVERMNGAPGSDPTRQPPPPVLAAGRPGWSPLTPITERSVATRDNTVDGHFDVTSPAAFSATHTDEDFMRGLASMISAGPDGTRTGSPLRQGSQSQPAGTGEPGPAATGPSVQATLQGSTRNGSSSSLPYSGQRDNAPAQNPAAPTTPSQTQAPPSLGPISSTATPPPQQQPKQQQVSTPNGEPLSPNSFIQNAWANAASLSSVSPGSPKSAVNGTSTVTGAPISTSPEQYEKPAVPSPHQALNGLAHETGPDTQELQKPPSLSSLANISPRRAGSPNLPRTSSPLANAPLSPTPKVTSPLAAQPPIQPAGTPGGHPSPNRPQQQPLHHHQQPLPQPQQQPVQRDVRTPTTVHHPEKPLLSPTSPMSVHSYPASAEYQQPDILAPKPSISRHSAVLDNDPKSLQALEEQAHASSMAYRQHLHEDPASRTNQVPAKPAYDNYGGHPSYQQQHERPQYNAPAPSYQQYAQNQHYGAPPHGTGQMDHDQGESSKVNGRPNDVEASPRRQNPMAFMGPSSPAPPASPGRQASSTLSSPSSLSGKQRPESPRSVEHHQGPSAFLKSPTSHASRTSTLGRKPSGARAQPGRKYPVGSAPSVDLHAVHEDKTPPPPPPVEATHHREPDLTSSTSLAPTLEEEEPVKNEMDDDYAYALAAMKLAEAQDHGDHADKGSPSNTRNEPALPPPPPIKEIPRMGSPSQFPSSFAKSKSAAERKAKSQAHQAAQQAAIMKPGHAGGKKGRKSKGAWNESSEEEEEDEDEDDDAGSDEVVSGGRGQMGPSGSGYFNQRMQTPPVASPGVGQYPQDFRRGTPQEGRPLPSPDSQSRNNRLLPSVPGSMGHPSRAVSGNYGPSQDSHEGHGRKPSGYGDYLTEGRARGQQEEPPSGRSRSRDPPPQLKKDIWSTALDPAHHGQALPQPGNRGTFVQLEPESETMTKAFTPVGLIHAGLQNQHDRSAKRQEEIARETGASLINVDSKPHDPQLGLLGAVTAHERERKREGGVGATLTRKLAEERLAEERQRKIDELQRNHLQQMSGGDGGSMYDMYGGGGMGGQFGNPMMTPGGGQFGYNPMMNPMMMNPMMMNPMMMGNPMMMMGGMGGSPNPQQMQMMAAQAAAMEAYQRAMMSFSQAGSVAPSEAGDPPSAGGSRIGTTSPMPGMMNPMMMGMMGMGGMGGMGAMGGMGMMGTPSGSPGYMQGSPGMFPQTVPYGMGQSELNHSQSRLSSQNPSVDGHTPERSGSRPTSDSPANGRPAKNIS
ncbi:hypothetical protein FRC02_012248 [Tulasnella sp. 418]|nr:hypothetical protein FRC02_012248 [Tulasnella sp. 418]